MRRYLSLPMVLVMILVACEYGDIHGKPESFDRIMGLRSTAKEILALRKGTIDFTGFFIFQFPESTADEIGLIYLQGLIIDHTIFLSDRLF